MSQSPAMAGGSSSTGWPEPWGMPRPATTSERRKRVIVTGPRTRSAAAPS
jgi:hypothetical protein